MAWRIGYEIQKNSFKFLRWKLSDLFEQIEEWHNDTPRLWIPDYEPTNEDIDEALDRIRSSKDKDLFLTVAEDEGGQAKGFIWAYRMEEPSDWVEQKTRLCARHGPYEQNLIIYGNIRSIL